MSVTITSPTNGSSVNYLSITGYSDANVIKVSVGSSQTKQVRVSYGQWSVTFSTSGLSSGDYLITATDSAFATASITIYLDLDSPSIPLLFSSKTSPTDYIIYGYADGGDTIIITSNNYRFEVICNNNNSFSLPFKLTTLTDTLTAYAINSGGSRSEESQPIYIDATDDADLFSLDPILAHIERMFYKGAMDSLKVNDFILSTQRNLLNFIDASEIVGLINNSVAVADDQVLLQILHLNSQLSQFDFGFDLELITETVFGVTETLLTPGSPMTLDFDLLSPMRVINGYLLLYTRTETPGATVTLSITNGTRTLRRNVVIDTNNSYQQTAIDITNLLVFNDSDMYLQILSISGDAYIYTGDQLLPRILINYTNF